MNCYPSDDILNVALQANIRSTLRLTSDISRALKCPVFDLPDTGAKMVYPTSHIIHLADQSRHHPLLSTISHKLRVLYNLLQHHQMCPEWITPQLRAIEQRIDDLIPDTPSIPIQHIASSLPMSPGSLPKSYRRKKIMKSPQSPRRIRRKSKDKKSRVKKSKYHQHCTSNTVPSTKSQSKKSTAKHSTEFKQLRTKITVINKKMDALQKRLDSVFGPHSKSPTTKHMVRRKKKKSIKRIQRSKFKESEYQRSVEIWNKMQRLQSLQKQAMSQLNGSTMSTLNVTVPAPSMIRADKEKSRGDAVEEKQSEDTKTSDQEESEDAKGDRNVLRKEIEKQRSMIEELERKINGMKQREDAIYQLTMEINKQAMSHNSS